MAKAKKAQPNKLHFWCPGCDEAHGIIINAPNSWFWNGSVDSPTFSPSVKVVGVQWSKGAAFYKRNHNVPAGDPIVCHSFVRDGYIQFLNDCTHQLAGRTVVLPDWPYE